MRTTTLSSLLVCYLGIGHVWADNTQHGPPDDIWMPNPSSQHLQASSNDGSEGPATRSNEWLASPGNIPTPPKTPWFKYIKKKGRVTVDVNNENNIPPPEPVVSEAPNNGTHVVELTPKINANNNNNLLALSLTADPFAMIRLLQFLLLASRAVMVAFLGTLRLLGPMVFARRVLAQGGELVSDYMMGRYMRTTFDHWERKYWKEYQGPAATRSCGRCFIHAAILMLLGKLMEWMIRPDNPPCLIPQTGACHWWCGLLWVVSVVGTGNFFAALISTRGPVKIKMTKSAMPNNLHHQKRRRRLFLTRPLQVLKGLRDPDHWLTSIATLRRNNANLREPFTPEPLLFPSTWPPFSMLRNFAIAKAMASSSQANSMHVIMRQFLIMHALLDEWHRVLMDERRVGLGLCIIATGFIAMCFLFVTVALTDNVSAVLLVPYLLATFGSGWMNLFCFWERRRNHERDLVVMRHGRQERRYSIKW